MMSAGVVRVTFSRSRSAKARLGPLIAALLILAAANGAVRLWKTFSLREVRQTYDRLSTKAQWLEAEVSELEKRQQEIQTQLAEGEARIASLDREIRANSGMKRLEAQAARAQSVERYRLLAGDYQRLYSEYEKVFEQLRELRSSVEELADRLGLQEPPR
jgi:chromosome segregation ATPase